jgi:predicted aldo/keto reductase-like oxidoreductase
MLLTIGMSVMKYRKFGKLDFKVSALGFGAMRLPIIGNDRSNIDEPEAIKMMRYAIDHGVNYVDTAYPYHNGQSEVVVGKTLKDGYREKVKLATKMPSWLIDSQSDMDKYFDEQLSRLQADYVDFYLLHGLHRERWEKLKKLDVLSWAEKMIDKGKIRHLGFSFHDDFDVFKEIVDGYDGWTFCQILFNYMDQDRQAGTQGLKYAASKGLAVVIMEPIAGGNLVVNPPQAIQALWDSVKTKRTQAEWALQWVWNHPEVSVVLSGMSTMQQVVENVKSASMSGPRSLSAKELQLIEKVRQKYGEYGFIGCTGCRYCLPCPQGVAIPEIFALFNEYYTKRGDEEAQKKVVEKYIETIAEENGAKNCAKCRQCEELCPQHLPISSLIANAERTFESEQPRP